VLLRAAAGIPLFAQGIAYFLNGRDLGLITWAVALLATLSGGLLLLGYLTPVASVLTGLISVSRFLWPQPPSPELFDSKLSTALVALIAVAIIGLGPGAFSIDARLFGRREIVIPDASHPGQS
jgi:uncharacterized membrane protein YphA (DoxX/SURF4 family)